MLLLLDGMFELILGHHHVQKGAVASHSSIKGSYHQFKLVVKYIKKCMNKDSARVISTQKFGEKVYI